MTDILLFGGSGQIGSALFRRLSPYYALAAPDSAAVDLSSAEQISNTIERLRPRLIINAAAYTAVDRAEQEPESALHVNGVAPGVMARQARLTGAALVHYSTDYVFDGSKASPYTENDAPAPLNVYGRSKLAGDRAVMDSGAPYLILRTSWVYGLQGSNFLLTMQRLLREREQVSVVDDQIGAPTWCESIADATVSILRAEDDLVESVGKRSGLYNMTCGGETTWYGFAQAIRAELLSSHVRLADLQAIVSADYPTAARRPAYSVLDNSRLHGEFALDLPHWRQALAAALA